MPDILVEKKTRRLCLLIPIKASGRRLITLNSLVRNAFLNLKFKVRALCIQRRESKRRRPRSLTAPWSPIGGFGLLYGPCCVWEPKSEKLDSTFQACIRRNISGRGCFQPLSNATATSVRDSKGIPLHSMVSSFLYFLKNKSYSSTVLPRVPLAVGVTATRYVFFLLALRCLFSTKLFMRSKRQSGMRVSVTRVRPNDT